MKLAVLVSLQEMLFFFFFLFSLTGQEKNTEHETLSDAAAELK